MTIKKAAPKEALSLHLTPALRLADIGERVANRRKSIA
jgi:hypothetical protein